MMISLTGFMGCGKSSVGRKLSALLSCPYIDLDARIEEAAGRSIPEIFAADGEQEFRRMEHRTLEETVSCPGKESELPANGKVPVAVLSLGGGTVMTPACAKIVRERTVCIYLRATADTLTSHLKHESAGRPMLASASDLRERIESLLAVRTSTYERTAHHIIDIDGKTIESVADEIIDRLHIVNQ